jgi:5-hydroxybenzimidazole methyltransferase
MKILPSDDSYATFCDLVSGYRMLSVITQAVNTGVIDAVGEHDCTFDQLLETTGLKPEEGRRFAALLVSVGILEQYDSRLYLSRFSRKYLLGSSPLSQRHVLEFENVLMDKWQGLGVVLSEGQGSRLADLPPEEYLNRLSLFQKAMGEAARVRSRELWDAFPPLPEMGLIIDAGAGDGAYLREFLGRYPGWRAVACDLQDVSALSGADADASAITRHSCNLADPDACDDFVARYGNTASVLLLSNFIHCYSEAENVAMVRRLTGLLRGDGILVIHDFCRDGNSFGAMYDIHMMVNTYNGRTYSFDETVRLLCSAGMADSRILELPSRSHAVVAGSQLPIDLKSDSLFLVRKKARELGFFAAEAVEPAAITTEPWVKAKCRYGCACYGKKWSCPPNSMDAGEFRELLASYSKAMVVAGQPPLRTFQEQLLELEKAAFLDGFKKALVFTGGPCTWCDSCYDDRCRFPEKRRPSLESCGCDVFALAESCGIPVGPVKNADDFVQYIGLILVE